MEHPQHPAPPALARPPFAAMVLRGQPLAVDWSSWHLDEDDKAQTQVSPFFRLPANVSAPGRLGRAA